MTEQPVINYEDAPVLEVAPHGTEPSPVATDAHGMPIVPTLSLGQDNSGGHQAIHVSLQLSAANPVVQLLGRDYDRIEAKILATGPAAAGTVTSASGSVAGTTAGQAIVTAAPVAAGTYVVNWTVILGGTLGAAERNNVALQVNGVTVATSINGINSGTVYPQLPVQVTVPAGAVIGTIIVGAPTASSVYQAGVTIQGQGTGPGPVVLAQSREIAEAAAAAGANFTGPPGAYLPAGVERTLRNCDELWAAWLGTTSLVSISISRRLPSEPHP
jgi:hypothetical protein